MEIKYNRKSTRKELIIGILFLAVGLAPILFDERISLIPLGGGLAYIINSLYNLKTNYVTVKEGYLKKKFGGKIYLNNLIEVKKFAGDYILKTKQTQITIDTNLVDKESLKELDEFIANLNVMKV
ncbi:hypothetical protein [Flavobacterium sp.]|uniref:hypothetical protein n=1 Tax=Flavobacterium sp. TaxID=239 RepID=UPI002B4AC7F7|nr:hypothetical protein [Flavobacterium sp.]HLF51476.1 hypothetical protein [Flavobacterium sp.]